MEELLVYYSNQGVDEPKTSFLFNFLEPKYENEIMNFTVEKSSGSSYYLNIPGKPKGLWSKSKYRENPEQFFLQELLLHLYTEIATKVSEYSLIDNHFTEDLENRESYLDNQFCKWIGKYLETSVARIYSLNYETNFKVILENHFSGTKIFDGFYEFNGHDLISPIAPDPMRILTDFSSNCHYNLHGSIYWDVDSENSNGFRIPNLRKVPYPSLPVNYDHTVIQNEKGKSILVAGIITGYQKIQKGALTPFRQMKFAFDRDTITADKLIIVGYSFGDEHINAAIGEAIKSNPKLKIIIVDPNFMKDDPNIIIRTFGHYGNGRIFPPKTLEKGRLHLFNNGQLVVHSTYFDQFLNEASDCRYEKWI
ncbi:SIR2 family protein [Cecembia rubra]|uniref:SIR2 family protein n=1 Tax=Cecembia rubra TaxID=1485585 RepID=UPI002714BE0D|nr:SIR2 family protein [Cecembia rubra]